MTLSTLLWVFLALSLLGSLMWLPTWMLPGKPLPRTRKFNMIFLKKDELVRVVKSITTLLGTKGRRYNDAIFLLTQRIINLWAKSGTIFTITYLAECMRLIFAYLSGEQSRDYKVWVRVRKYSDGTALPYFIPHTFRRTIIYFRWAWRNNTYQGWSFVKDLTPWLVEVRSIISILATVRSMSGHHYLKFKSVTDPFTGQSKTWGDLRYFKRQIGILSMGRLKVNKPDFFLSGKCGVNSSSAFLSIGYDLIAYMMRPHLWKTYVIMCWRLEYYQLMIFFIINSLILFPILVTIMMRNLIVYPFLVGYYKARGRSNSFRLISLDLGRLSVIKEARGKARVIGITDHWTQWLFKPLHEGLSEILDCFDEDGTRDQLGPLKYLLVRSKREKSRIVSVDLSAATDRLPVQLQADLLSAYGYPGDLWMALLQRPYTYLGKEYVYSVGQPMGVYSSFTMLAITNHFLCRLAIFLSGVAIDEGTGQYAVLGDDVVHRIPKSADVYTKLLRQLGVSVNPIKGFNGDLLEFAKQVILRDGTNVSPLGAKSILHATRSPTFLASVLADMSKKGFITKNWTVALSSIHNWFEKLHGKTGNSRSRYVLSVLGPQGGLWFLSKDNLCVKQMETLFKQELSLSWGLSFESYLEYYQKYLAKKSWLRSPFSGTGELWKSFSIFIRPLAWTDTKNTRSPRHLVVMTLLTILPTPLFLLVREGVEKMLDSLKMWFLMILSQIIFVDESFNDNRLLWFKEWSSKDWQDKWKSLKAEIRKRWLGVWTNVKDYTFATDDTQREEILEEWTLVPEELDGQFWSEIPQEQTLQHAQYFSIWMSNLHLLSPLQILTEAQQGKKTNNLPALKVTDRVLSFLSPEYATWFIGVRNSERKAITSSKLKKLRSTRTKDPKRLQKTQRKSKFHKVR